MQTAAGMRENELLSKITLEYGRILKDNLVGIYVHGSVAFGCFNWDKSDVDFLAVVKSAPTHEEKILLIQALLDMESECPKKGVEMSVVLEEYCRNFIYPTPYELHYSVTHREKCKKDLETYCREMNGTDIDLATHFTVIKSVGFTLCGRKIESVFGDVPEKNYLDSIKCDVENAQNDIFDNPVYVILNLCRVCAFIRDGIVCSKKQGGIWGMKNLPESYAPIVKEATDCYTSDKEFSAEGDLLEEFARFMQEKICVSADTRGDTRRRFPH